MNQTAVTAQELDEKTVKLWLSNEQYQKLQATSRLLDVSVGQYVKSAVMNQLEHDSDLESSSHYHDINFRMTERDIQLMDASAKNAGLGRSAWLHMVLVGISGVSSFGFKRNGERKNGH